jgi:hypothetical protein
MTSLHFAEVYLSYQGRRLTLMDHGDHLENAFVIASIHHAVLNTGSFISYTNAAVAPSLLIPADHTSIHHNNQLSSECMELVLDYLWSHQWRHPSVFDLMTTPSPTPVGFVSSLPFIHVKQSNNLSTSTAIAPPSFPIVNTKQHVDTKSSTSTPSLPSSSVSRHKRSGSGPSIAGVATSTSEGLKQKQSSSSSSSVSSSSSSSSSSSRRYPRTSYDDSLLIGLSSNRHRREAAATPAKATVTTLTRRSDVSTTSRASSSSTSSPQRVAAKAASVTTSTSTSSSGGGRGVGIIRSVDDSLILRTQRRNFPI